MFIFARHGETEWNDKDITQGQTDVPLNDQGRRDAAALRTWLQENVGPIDACYASDLERASETARIAVDEDSVQTDERLREQHFGVCQGQNMASFLEENPSYRVETLLDYHTEWPEGESTIDVYKRVTQTIDELRAAHTADETVLVVAHATPLICLYDYLGEGTLREAPYPDNGNLLSVPFNGTVLGSPTRHVVSQPNL